MPPIKPPMPQGTKKTECDMSHDLPTYKNNLENGSDCSPSSTDLFLEDDLEDILLSMFTVTIMMRRHRISNVLRKILPSFPPQTSKEDSPTDSRCHIPDPPGSAQSVTETTNSEETPPTDCDPVEEGVEHDNTDTKETSLIVEGSDDYDEDEEEDELRDQVEHSQEVQDEDEEVKEDDFHLDPDPRCNSGSHHHSKRNSPLLSEEDLYIEEGVRSLLCEVIFEESGEELRLEEQEEELKEEEEEDEEEEEEDDEDDMDWMYFNPDVATFNSLGCYVGDKYKVAENARDTLVLMTKKLKEEDHILRTFRRALGHNQVIQKDLAPILVETADDQETFGAAIG